MDREIQKLKKASVIRIARFALDSINQLFWPAACDNCRQTICETDSSLCKTCWNQLIECTGADYCQRCGRNAAKAAMLESACPECMGKEVSFDRIARAGIYAHSLAKMILSFKNGKTQLDSILGFLAESAFQGSGYHNEIDFFVPVPLHWSRRLVRGYNQSHLIAFRIAQSRKKINTDLVRIRRTKLQPAMASPAARARNVAGAFAVRSGHNFAEKKICLVDDIKTTGATLNECAKMLKQAGAKKVFALVLAVAGQKI
ncbi:ComF family protein [Planctomycetota bacterium]